MRFKGWLALGIVAVVLASCGGGSSGTGGGTFSLIEFLEAGQSDIPRNRILTFVFSQALLPTQDFSQRLKIQNVVAGQSSNFSLAVGRYVIAADRATFVPKLPEQPDRSDAGFRSQGSYAVFVKAGPDALQSLENDTITSQQEFFFNTNAFFEDPIPSEPPRVIRMFAVDQTSGVEIDLSRSDPRPSEQAAIENSDFIASGLVIDPGAGGAPDFGTLWQFNIEVSEPIDPETVTTDNITMIEIFDDATKSGPTAPPVSADDGFGTPVSFKVPINVEVIQELNDDNEVDVFIRVTPVLTLVDNARYQLSLSGNILGLDYRKQFVGDNGLTGDGATETSPGLVLVEPGGLGYQTEFLVRDRPAITTTRVLEFDPIVDGVQPELGQTETDETKFNTSLYNPLTIPSQAVGFLAGFGNGSDGPLAVSGGNTVTVDTGDVRNPDLGNPFTVIDLNPMDRYNENTLPGAPVTYDSPEFFELQLNSLIVSSSSTLRVIGVNPLLLRVKGIVQINGVIDIAGGDGEDAVSGTASGGTAGGGAGFAGGEARPGPFNARCWIGGSNSCQSFQTYLDCATTAAANVPYSDSGEGPGRGMRGGESWSMNNDATNDQTKGITGTGGGGGSHGTQGTPGQDVNSNGIDGTDGGNCKGGNWSVRHEGVVGVRGQPGPTYGDREVIDVLFGGSGAGAGGTQHARCFIQGRTTAGAGGGGGGSISIYASSGIFAGGGVIDASGGDGGQGQIISWGGSSTNNVSGSGGAGAGGTIVLISGDQISLAGAVLDARGGVGGIKSHIGTMFTSCPSCNEGGDGGQGLIFLMDSDGTMDGFIPGLPGEYDNFTHGVLTISEFNTERFGAINAITELYNAGAADPRYQELSPTDVVGTVAPGQRIRIFQSTAKADVDEPLIPDQTTEEPNPAVEIALVEFASGAVAVDISGNATALNPVDDPARRSYLRCNCLFEYDDPVQSALGPFASIDRVVNTIMFNG